MADEELTRETAAKTQEDAIVKHWEEQDAILLKHREEAYNIGGEEQIKRLTKQGKKPMRELITMLIDPGTDFFELGLDAGYNIGQIKLYGGECL